MSRRSVWAALASLLAGLWIFLVYRSGNCLVNVLASRVFPEGWFEAVREHGRLPLPWPDFWIYQLPGGLWVFATTLVIWNLPSVTGRWQWSWRAVPVVVATGFEVAQALGVTDGTPDAGDLVAAWAGCALACGWMFREQDAGRRSPRRWQGAACAACHALLFLADEVSAAHPSFLLRAVSHPVVERELPEWRDRS